MMSLDSVVGYGWASFIRGAVFGIVISSIVWVKVVVSVIG